MADGTILKRGDVLRIETGGGGGWGHPYDREPERVREDVRGGLVSVEAAARDYGVVLAGPDLEVDADATRKARANRPDAALFHRKSYSETIA